MEPFALAGSVDVYPGVHLRPRRRERRLRGAAAGRRRRVAALDPEEACQQAIEAGLVVHRAHPLNCETSIPALIGGVVMPNAHFYVRNHFQIPDLDASAWRLQVGGLVERPLALGLRDLHHDAVGDAGRHARVRRQRPLQDGPAGSGRAVASRRGEHRRVDRRPARRGARSGRHQAGGQRDRVPGRRQRDRRRARARSAFERSLSIDTARDSRGAAGLRDERRAAPDPARLPGPARRARLVRRGLGEVADRDRGRRRPVRRATSRSTSTSTTSSEDGQIGAGAGHAPTSAGADHRPTGGDETAEQATSQFGAWPGRARRRSPASR